MSSSAGQRVHVGRVERRPALGKAAEDLVRDPVTLVLAVADRRGELRLFRVVGEQVAQQLRRALHVAP
jgi:hypothetical protein